MKLILFSLVLFLSSMLNAQSYSSLDSYKPEVEFDNIHVVKIAEDSLQSSFIIWVKKGVKNHFHKEHTENIVVLDGEAAMTVGETLHIIKKGDFLNIPKGTPHAVTKVLSSQPLKVLSVQTPIFSGKDRVFIEK